MRKLEHIVEPESLLLSWQEPVGRMRYVVGSDGQKLGYVMRGISPQFVAWIQAGHLHGEIVRMNGTNDRPVMLHQHGMIEAFATHRQ